MNVYFGTTHSHTGADNNHSPDESHARDVFEAAKADGFDFLLLTEHSGPSGPDNPVAFYADVLTFQKVDESEVAGEAWEKLEGVFGLRMRTARLRLHRRQCGKQRCEQGRGPGVSAVHVAIIGWWGCGWWFVVGSFP